MNPYPEVDDRIRYKMAKLFRRYLDFSKTQYEVWDSTMPEFDHMYNYLLVMRKTIYRVVCPYLLKQELQATEKEIDYRSTHIVLYHNRQMIAGLRLTKEDFELSKFIDPKLSRIRRPLEISRLVSLAKHIRITESLMIAAALYSCQLYDHGGIVALAQRQNVGILKSIGLGIRSPAFQIPTRGPQFYYLLGGDFSDMALALKRKIEKRLI